MGGQYSGKGRGAGREETRTAKAWVKAAAQPVSEGDQGGPVANVMREAIESSGLQPRLVVARLEQVGLSSGLTTGGQAGPEAAPAPLLVLRLADTAAGDGGTLDVARLHAAGQDGEDEQAGEEKASHGRPPRLEGFCLRSASAPGKLERPGRGAHEGIDGS
jgi:hypothetical protein